MLYKVFLVLLLCFVTMTDPCDQRNFKDCINVQGAQCRYIETLGRCFPSYSTDLGCHNGLSKENCLSQQDQCEFVTQCLPVTEFMLQRLTCRNRKITKKACLNLKSPMCRWHQEECQIYDSKPKPGVSCESSYDANFVSPMLCSQIPEEICWHNGEKCNDARSILNTVVCSQPGLSQAACRLIITKDEKCIFNKLCRTIKEQEIPLLKCNNIINRSSCFIVKNEACQWSKSRCQLANLEEDCQTLTENNDLACSLTKGYCKYNAKEFKCENADLTKVTCDTVGLSYQACMALEQACIITEGRCQTMTWSSQQVCSGNGRLNKKACLSITTTGQVCHWDGKECLDYSGDINQDTQCLNLKDVNGNACQRVIKGTCKFDIKNQQCVETEEGDQCTTQFMNVNGCIFVTKPDQACQWQESKCKPKKVIPLKTKCTDLINSNAIACSQVDSNEDIDFTCLFDPIWQGCRHFKVGEANTIKCGDISKGLNRYACALVTTPGQACHFTQRRCVVYPITSVAISCLAFQFVNAATCALSIYEQNNCRYDAPFFSCSPHLDLPNLSCNVNGLNSYGCMAVVKEKCFFDKSIGKCVQFNAQSNPNPTCSTNGPNIELCLNLTTVGQYCLWQDKLSQCQSFKPDSTKVCDMYKSVNSNVCTAVEVKDPAKNNGEAFCIHNRQTSNCEKLKPDYTCPQNDPCCSDVLGINIHVCSGRSDPNLYCYFTNTRCTRYLHFGAPPNQMILLAEQEYARRKLLCHAVNYSGCGILNYDPNLLCSMSNSRDICNQYSEKEFREIQDYTIFAAPNAKTNKWICRKITATNVFMAYDTKYSKCKVLTRENNIIRCEEPNINSEACRNLTPEDYCVWVPETLTCNTIPDDELKNYGCDTLINETACVEKQGQCMYNRTLGKCQTMATMDPNKDCTYYAGGQFTYSPEICAMITKTGQACSYSYATLQCQTQIVIQSTCDNIGFNISSCLGFTSSLCQWDAINNKCVTVAQDKVDTFNCNDNINKSVCLKTQTKSCFWDTEAIKCQPENYNAATTCQALMKTGKQFSVKACTQITYPGSICSYDEANMICTNTGFTTSERCDIIANIHLCLGNTQYSYCQYDSITNVCSNFINSRNDLKCSEYKNINRDVCVEKTGERCKFDLSKSLCELHTSFTEDTKCSDLFKSGGFLYSRSLCIAVLSKKDKLVIGPSKTYCKVKAACQNEQYCQYSVEEQACSWVVFGEEKESISDCIVTQKVFTSCDSNFSKAACTDLISAPCSFNWARGGCIAIDDSEASSITKCENVTASGCPMIATIGLNCYVRTKTVLEACNIPMASYQQCADFSELLIINKSSCYTFLANSLPKYIINPNVCSAATTGICDFDQANNTCKLSSRSRNCMIPGLSYQACDTRQCEYNYNRCLNKNDSGNACTTNYQLNQVLNTTNVSQSTFQTSQQLELAKSGCSTNSSCGWLAAQTTNRQQFNSAECSTFLTQCSTTRTSQYNSCKSSKNYDSYNDCVTKATSDDNNCRSVCSTAYNQCSGDCAPNNLSICITPCSNTLNLCNGGCNTINNCTCWTDADSTYDNCAADKYKTKEACQYKYFQCETVTITDCDLIKQQYLYTSQSTCISTTGSGLCYYNSDSQCTSLPSSYSETYQQISCYQLNKTACLDNYLNQRCAWVNNQCKLVSVNILRTLTECLIVNASACPYLNAPCRVTNNKCERVEVTLTCAELGSTSNSLTCSMLINSQVCYYNTNTCTQYSGIDQKFECTQLGLNKLGCFINTKGKCYYDTACKAIKDVDCTVLSENDCLAHPSKSCVWDQNACKDILPFLINNLDCTVLNYNACLAHPSKPCVWNANACNNIAYSSGTQTCSSFIANSIPSTFVNEISCSRISGPACVYVGTTCQSAPSITGCTTNGINKEACLVNTTGQCKYQEKCFNSSCERKCVPISDLNQECSPLFNIVQCVSLINQPCIFKNGACSTFTMNCAETNYAGAMIMLGASQYTSIICSNINVELLSIIYDPTLKQCIQVTVADLPCNTKLMNKNACLSYTNEFCVYDNTNDQPCTRDSFKVTKHRCLPYMEGNLLTDTCNSNQNWKVCLGLVKASCQFMNNVCSEVPANVTCASLSTSLIDISQFTCQSRTDVACSYDKTNNRCIFVTSKVLTCEEIGLNIVGCLANTTTVLCEWNETTKKCQNVVKQDYKCTDLINVTNCLLVSLPGQQCVFQDNKCQTVTTSSLCISGLNVNAAACTIAANIGCKYNSVTRKCQAADHTENCLFNLTLNEKACYQNISDNYCHWSSGKCVEPTDFSTLLCQDSVNLKTCTHITNPTQLCQYIKPLDGANYCMNVIPVVKQCNQNININKPDLCIIAIGGPCWYNVDTRSCEILTQILDVCDVSLNRDACLTKVSSKCEFTDRCREANTSTNTDCIQATSKQQCVVINLLCQWSDNKCQQVPVPLTCVENMLDITPKVCASVITEVNSFCLYDYTKLTCMSSIPTTCDVFKEQIACLKVQTMQCLWMGQQCVDYAPIKGMDECTLFLDNATKSVCLGIYKRGQMCEFIGERCQTAKYEDGWQDRVNIGACIGQRLEPCYFENLKCKCPPLTELQSLYKITKCNDKLSYLLCLSLETDGEYCQWTDEVCQSQAAPTTITIESHSQISPNFCRHIIDVAVAYSFSSHSCQTLINIDLDCIYPGLNKLGCLKLRNACTWKDEKCQFFFSQLKARRMLAINEILTIVQSNVSIGVCNLLTQPVQFYQGSCVLINNNTSCSDQGVNQVACYQIISEPCIWENNECQFYYPFEPCLDVPKKVNAQVCGYVDLDVCSHDYLKNECVVPTDKAKCSTAGLNYRACIQISGCVFNKGKCSMELPDRGCSNSEYANPKVCSSAINACVYDPIRQRCTGITQFETCDSVGLSKMACEQLSKCQYNMSLQKCECKRQISTLCQLADKKSCESYDHCIYAGTQCRKKQCEDLSVPLGNKDVMIQACTAMPNCYLVNQSDRKCKLATTCEEVEFNKQYYNSCADIFIQNRPCNTNQDKCIELVCASLVKDHCKDYSKYCHFDANAGCVEKQCEHITSYSECANQNNCFPYFEKDKLSCKYLGRCNSITVDYGKDQSLEYQCNHTQEIPGVFRIMAEPLKGVQCGYVNKKCLNSPCRTFGSMEMDCIGKLINNQNVCILDSTYVCQACEEIANSCDCLEHETHCKYDVTTQKCVSITCPAIIDNQQCTLREDCHYENKACFTKCQYHFSQWACTKFGCNWSTNSNSCEQCLSTNATTCSNKIETECKADACCGYIQSKCQIQCKKLNMVECNQESKSTKKCIWNIDKHTCASKSEPRLLNDNSAQSLLIIVILSLLLH